MLVPVCLSSGNNESVVLEVHCLCYVHHIYTPLKLSESDCVSVCVAQVFFSDFSCKFVCVCVSACIDYWVCLSFQTRMHSLPLLLFSICLFCPSLCLLLCLSHRLLFLIWLNSLSWPLWFRCHLKCFFNSLSPFRYLLISSTYLPFFPSLPLCFPPASLPLIHPPISLSIIPTYGFLLFLPFTCSFPCLPSYW